MSDKHLVILRHSLGYQEDGTGKRYRNFFCAEEGTADYAACEELAGIGMMRDLGPVDWMGGLHYFVVTESGVKAVDRARPQPRKLTRSQERYQKFLEADIGCSFSEFIGSRGCLR